MGAVGGPENLARKAREGKNRRERKREAKRRSNKKSQQANA